MSTNHARPVAVTMQKLGLHRGSRRLWVEGSKLSRAGIVPGERFKVSWDPSENRVTLTFGADGDRVVSRRERHNRVMPIIDIGAEALEDALGEGIERAQVTIYRGRIEVEVHPDDVAVRERIARLVSKVRSGREIETGSLAHGGGILDHALHTGLADSGIRSRLAFAVEIDQSTIDAAATRNPLWKEGLLEVHAPLQEVPVKALPKVDILVAGLPCTGASKSGKAKNGITKAESHPTAGGLVVPFLQIVRETAPSLVVLENVVDYAYSASADLIRASLETWGYDVHETVLDGRDFGALEDRRRLCLIGVTKGLLLDLRNLRPGTDAPANLAAILEDIGPDSDRWRSFSHHVAKQSRNLENGSNFKLQMLTPEATRVGTMGAGYHKDRQTEPHLRHPTDPTKARLLTPVEHARAKTVPPFLVEGLSPMVAHRILGNSVVWKAWREVGRHMGEAMAHVSGVSVYEGEATFASILETYAAPNLALDAEAEELDDEMAPAPAFGR